MGTPLLLRGGFLHIDIYIQLPSTVSSKGHHVGKHDAICIVWIRQRMPVEVINPSESAID